MNVPDILKTIMADINKTNVYYDYYCGSSGINSKNPYSLIRCHTCLFAVGSFNYEENLIATYNYVQNKKNGGLDVVAKLYSIYSEDEFKQLIDIINSHATECSRDMTEIPK